MNATERSVMVDELRQITNPRTLKTDDEARNDRTRADEICKAFGVEFPEDVFDYYGRYGK